MPLVHAELLEVIAPNFGRNYSGVSATIERVLRLQSKTYCAAAVGRPLADDVPQIRLLDLLKLAGTPGNRKWRIWHARRNNDMVVGLLLKKFFRIPLKLVFTSASQRSHTGFTRFLIQHMDAVIAPSEKSASYLFCPVVVIPHGMDTVNFRPPKKNRRALRARLKLPDRTLIGCFGRVRHDKGTDLFAEAMIEIMRERSDVYCVICGLTKPRYRKFEQSIKERIMTNGLSDRFIWRGEIGAELMPAMYQSMDLLIAPQRSEGFGLTPLEAMACAVPVVATGAGAFPDQIVQGVTGRIVATGSAQAITLAVADLLANPAGMRQMGAEGRKRVVRHFPLENEVGGLNQVYETLWSNQPFEDTAQHRSPLRSAPID